MNFTIFTWQKQESVLTKLFTISLKNILWNIAKSINFLQKYKDAMLAFYDFKAEHWSHIRTTNTVESAFATVRLGANKMKIVED